MEIAFGALVASIIALFGVITKFDSERPYYPMVLIVIALFYGLFAAVGGVSDGIWIEVIAIMIFIGLAIAGFRKSLWFVCVGLIAHGIFDLLHADLVNNGGVPEWWPVFCATVDVLLGALVAIFLRVGRWRQNAL